jgi:zinc protease
LQSARTNSIRLVDELPFGPTLRVKRYALKNGLRMLTLLDRTAPVVSFHTWFAVGSRNEHKGKTGLAHLFEHLMFNETKRAKKGQFDQRIESAGGETNASTWTDWTHYHTELPASQLPVIMELEADRMHNLILRPPQVRSEKDVVANERRFRVDDDVEGEVHEILYRMAFKRHPYGHPTIGSMRDIKSFTPRDCERFYRTYYAPNNALLVVAGDFNEKKLLKEVQRLYGRHKPAKLPPPPSVVEPVQKEERVRRLHRPTPTRKLALGYHAPAFGDADYSVLSLINELLFVGRSARVYQRLVRKEQLAAEVHAGIAPFVNPGLYDIWITLQPDAKLKQTLEVLDQELERIATKKVSAAELRRVKNRAELSFLMAMETSAGKAEQIGFYETVLGDAGKLMGRLDDFRAVTAEDVLRVARKVLDKNQRTRIEVLPAKGKRK